MKLALVLSLIFFQLSSTSYAALGADESSIEVERQGKSSCQKTQFADYTQSTCMNPTHTVNQYTNLDGKVFAVTWRGVSRPSMSTYMGEHLGEYQKAMQNSTRQVGRKPGKITTDKIIVGHSGHMRDVRGYAYLPALTPKDVKPEVLP